MQHTHYTSTFDKKQFPIILVCDNVQNAANIGGLFRIADAFGVEQLIFCGEGFSLGKRFKKTSRSTEKYVDFEIENDIEKILKQLRARKYSLIALEITENSYPISDLKALNNPIALIVGNEKSGISDNVLMLVDKTIHINMYGDNSSMNVVNATSVALYQITESINKDF